MSSRLVIKDAARQLIGRLISALFGFITIKIMTPYLGPLRYGDYSTILKYFAIWTALADLWLYVLAVKRLWVIKEEDPDPEQKQLKTEYGKYVGTRVIIMVAIYTLALVVAYFLPVYTTNPYLIRGLPFGMIFSASVMFAGIQQLPLQLFWRMEQLSITLITARIFQILILVPVVYIFYKNPDFSQTTTLTIIVFCLILFSVVWSWIGQNIEIHIRANKILPLRIIYDRAFTKTIIKDNRRYGIGYFLSSFHTLIVLLFLGWFFPTTGGNDYSWVWALSLSLIEILLIIPQALGNSLLHKIAPYTEINKRKSMWSLMLMVIWIWWLAAINFAAFSTPMIRFISGEKFLGVRTNLHQRWSDQVLPFLGIVLFASFIKQIYNYLFVSVEKQNFLLRINLFGVVLGTSIWIPLIQKRGLAWGAATQLMIELMFMFGWMRIAKTHKIDVIFEKWIFPRVIAILIWTGIVWYIINQYVQFNTRKLLWILVIFNGIVALISLPTLKKIAKKLAIENWEYDEMTL